MATVFEATIFERTAVAIMARVQGASGAIMTPSQLSAVQYDLWRVDAVPTPPDFLPEGQPIHVSGPTSLTVANVMLTSVSFDGWTKDTIGYNFITTLAGSLFDSIPLGIYPKPYYYRVDFKFTPVTGEPFGAAIRLETTQWLFGK